MHRLPTHAAALATLTLSLAGRSSLAQPCTPIFLSSVGGVPNGIVVENEVAYIASNGGGLLIVDVSRDQSPEPIAVVSVPGGADGVVLESSTAYLWNWNFGVFAIDVSNPLTPNLLGSLELPYVEGIDVSDGVIFAARAKSGLSVVDATKPTSMAVISTTLTNESNGRTLGVAVEGGVIFVADDSAGLVVYDGSNPGSPTKLSATAVPDAAHAVVVNQSLAYVSNGTNIHVLDVYNPSAPDLVSEVSLEYGAWDPVVSGNMLIIQNPLPMILDVEDPLNPTTVMLLPNSPLNHAAIERNRIYMTEESGHVSVLDLDAAPVHLVLGRSLLLSPIADLELVGDLAIATALHTLQVLDLRDPSLPTLRSALDLSNRCLDLALTDRTLMASTQRALDLFDVSVPDRPRMIGSTDAPSNCISIETDGAFTFQLEYLGIFDRKLDVTDVRDPTNPVLVSSVEFSSPAWNTAYHDGLLFLAGGYFGLTVIDVSDPFSPEILDTIADGRYCGDVACAGDLVYIASDGILVLDLSDPLHPIEIGSTSHAQNFLELAVQGRAAFMGSGARGEFQIVDITDPTDPQVRGSSTSYIKEWNIYPIGNTVCVAGKEAGMLVLDVSSCLPCPADLTGPNSSPSPYTPLDPDGAVNGADLSHYVELWLEGSYHADLTTTNTNPGDLRHAAPDDLINGADLAYFVEAWIEGCAN